jgi:hypothetical protein
VKAGQGCKEGQTDAKGTFDSKNDQFLKIDLTLVSDIRSEKKSSPSALLEQMNLGE